MFLSACLLMVTLNTNLFCTEPFKQQKEFLYSAVDPAKRYVCAFSGLQGGKTLTGADAAWALLYGPEPMMLPPHIRNRMSAEFWIVSKSYMLARVAFETFRMRTPDSLLRENVWMTEKDLRGDGLKRDDKDHFWLRPRGGVDDQKPISVRVRTASDPENLRATPNLVLLHADELAYWKESAWLNAQGRGIVARTKYLITTTPHGRNYVYRDLYLPGQQKDSDIAIHAWTSADNPYADKEFISRLRKKFGSEYASQELDAHFITNVGYVYDFDRDKHCVAELPSLDPEDYKFRVVGVDPGYGDPYAACLCLMDHSGHWYIADELYLPSKAVVDDAYPKLKAWKDNWKITTIYVDKRRPTDAELLRRKGLPAQANLEIYGEHDRRTIMPMVRVVQGLFRENRLTVLDRCEWTCEEFENYAFADRDEKNAGENPVDWKNHAMDSARYAIASVEKIYNGAMQFADNPRTGKFGPIGRGYTRKPGERFHLLPPVNDMIAQQDKNLDAAAVENNSNG